MKKILLLLSLFLMMGCYQNTIVTDRVAMNVKLPSDGKYRIKIRQGITNELISQEMISAEMGDNILTVYVASLDKSGYMIQLTDEYHNILGNQSFVVN
jgi:low affinity Fe/Cu permease